MNDMSGAKSINEALEAHALDLSYRERSVLRGVSVSVRPGEIVAVIGANGAGKSTLLKTMAGLVVPTSGRVTLRGRAIGDIDRGEFCREVAYLPQERAVHWPMTVRQLVALGRLPHRARLAPLAREDMRAVDRAMEAMDVSFLAERPANELSGGELSRVLLARALAQEASFLIADEPSTGLDPAHSLTLFTQLVRLAGQKRGVIVALHDLSIAARFCDTVLMLQCGGTLARGAPEEVLTPEHLAQGFGVKAVVGKLGGHPVVMAAEPLNPSDAGAATRGPVKSLV